MKVWVLGIYHESGVKLFANKEDAEAFYEKNQDIWDYYMEVEVN